MDKILICDDDRRFGNDLGTAIRSILDTAGRSTQIHIYESAEDIPKQILCDCDIAFLDIDFAQNGYTGIDIARQLRSLQNHAVIIFVTNFIEYAPEGYEVQAFRYLLKTEMDKKLKLYLTQALDHLVSVKRTFPISISGDVINIPLDDVLFMEAKLHNVIAHTANTSDNSQEYRFYSTLSDVEKQLTPHGFLRIHKSFLVNMKHLVKFQCKEAVLSDGTVLKVSEKNYAQQKKAYLLWKGRL